jgi:hypothetical protein
VLRTPVLTNINPFPNITPLLGFANPGEKIPRRNLVKRLLDPIKGTNLFTQQ